MGESQVPIRIRRATPDDSAAIAFVLAEAFVEYKSLYTEEGYAATTPAAEQIEKRFGNDLILVAVRGEDIVGTVSAVLQGSEIYIRSMAILSHARGQKIGQTLLGYIEECAVKEDFKRLKLSTAPFLDRAICLYEQFGFVRVGVDDLHGTPLITMEKTL
jgi:GNAT superfamily N-acetyltransferase